MALDPKKRQKKLAKKASKRKEKISQINAESSKANAYGLANLPIHECLVPDNMFEIGLGHVFISRKMISGGITLSVFMVDTFCLGVKDAFIKNFTEAEYHDVKVQLCRDVKLIDIAPSNARKIVEESIKYAHSVGFEPHKDYMKSSKIFGNIDINECKETFIFGKDGKPLYISDPNDSIGKSKRILIKLEEYSGENKAE